MFNRRVESATLGLGEFNGDGIKISQLSTPAGEDCRCSWVTEMDHFGGHSTTPGFESSIAVGEFNGDGIQDLVVDGGRASDIAG